MPEPVLSVEGVTAGYVPDLPILRNVSMIAEAAKITAIIGPNGAGKSTLVKAVAGLVPVSSGRVLHRGRDITNIRPDRMAAERVAYVPQTDNIFRTLTVRENLELALRRAGDAAHDRLTALFDRFPPLKDKHAEKAGALSGGQRQFLAVANALATEPQLILMDEPSAGLAPKAAEEVLQLARQLTQGGVTIVLVEQNVTQALRLSDHCYILAEGRNQIDGKAVDLLGDKVVADIYLGGKRLRVGGMIQHLVDGILVGAIYSLGAIGLTMVMHMLRFANFSHSELLSVGAYSALVFSKLLSALAPVLAARIGPLSMSFALALAVVLAMAVTAATALFIDRLVFRRIRARGDPLSMVFAAFGIALIIRSLIGLIFGLGTALYSRDIPFALLISADPLLLVRPDQIMALVVALVLMAVLHVVLSRTTFGYALRAVAENPSLAQVGGIHLGRIIAAVWIIGAALAATAGVFYALTNQITPTIGHDLLMPVFAATIVGGIGSIYGAALGGFLVGLAANLSLLVLPSGYSPSLPFLIILVTLILRPNGLFGVARA